MKATSRRSRSRSCIETSARHKTTAQIYGDKLIAEGLITEAEFEKMKADWRAHLEGEWEVGQHYKPNKADWLDGAWSGCGRPTTRMNSAAARPPCRSRR